MDMKQFEKEALELGEMINEAFDGKNMFVISLAIIATKNVIEQSDPNAWAAALEFTKKNPLDYD